MNEDPNAQGREERLGPDPHAKIAERLLEYRRRLRHEAGTEQPAGAESSQTDTTLAEPDRTDARSEPSPMDDRQIRERIARLDETLARISAMLPLLRGKRGVESDDRS